LTESDKSKSHIEQDSVKIPMVVEIRTKPDKGVQLSS